MLLDERHTKSVFREKEEKKLTDESGGKGKETWMDTLAKLEWLGLTKISDEDYANMLTESVVGLEAKMALIEEEIERLRADELDGGEGSEKVEG